jgi:hypothetical protein
MPSGFYVRNADSFIQIDGSHQNLVLKDAGNVSVGASSSTTVRVSAQTPCVAVRPDQGVVVYWLNRVDATSWDIVFSASDNQGATARWFLFDRQDEVTEFKTDYGLRVSNEFGQVVFDSRQRYMRVLGMVTPTISTGSVSWTFDEIPAFVLCGTAFRGWLRSGANDVRYIGRGASRSDNTLYYYPTVVMRSGPWNGGDGYLYDFPASIVFVGTKFLPQ